MRSLRYSLLFPALCLVLSACSGSSNVTFNRPGHETTSQLLAPGAEFASAGGTNQVTTRGYNVSVSLGHFIDQSSVTTTPRGYKVQNSISDQSD